MSELHVLHNVSPLRLFQFIHLNRRLRQFCTKSITVIENQKSPHSECGPDLKCRCSQGYHSTYLPAPILSSRPPTLVYCQILSELGSNAAMANGTGPQVEVPGSEMNSTVIPMIEFYPSKSAILQQ